MTKDAQTERPVARHGQPNPPTFKKSAFDCPYCGVFAQMDWREASPSQAYARERMPPNRAHWARCDNCSKEQYWIVDAFDPDASPFEAPIPRVTRMVFPAGGQSSAPRAHPDMPEDVRTDYDEARAIVDSSVRGACALLRLATEKFVQQLQPDGRNLNDRIGKLVAKESPLRSRKASTPFG